MEGKKMNAVAAKQFLIARVIEEAELQQVLLSDVEKKMLYFILPRCTLHFQTSTKSTRNSSETTMPPGMKRRSQPFLGTLVTETAAHLQFGSKSGRMR
jgi:hypothetical protein